MPGSMWFWRSCVLGILLLAGPRSLRADAPSSPPSDPLAGSSPSRHWADGPTRLFLAGTADLGVSARAKMIIGYGKPHWAWVGVEYEAVTTTEVGANIVRARIALLIADLAVGYRRTWSYRRGFMTREDSYTDDDLTVGPNARYHSLDAWLWGIIPIGRGFVDWELEAVRTYGVPAQSDVYEEWLRAPVRPGLAAATRLAYAHTFIDGKLAIGAMGEYVWLGGRGNLFRVGPMVLYGFTPHWEINTLLTMVVDSPDELGFYNGLWGTLRVRYRFATGDRRSRR